MKKALISFLLSAACAATALAVPAKPGAMKMRQPDGSEITVFLRGDEHAHMYYSEDGYALAFGEDGYFRYAQVQDGKVLPIAGSPIASDLSNRSAAETNFVGTLQKVDFATYYSEKQSIMRRTQKRISPQESLSTTNFPTIGSIKGLVLLVEFKDNSFSFDHDYHDRMLNEEDFSEEGGTGSARDYFIDQSMGKLQPYFDVIGPVKLDKPIAYYGRNNSYGDDMYATLMIKEACEIADAQFGCDFSDYDFDKDGAVDMVFVIYAGYGEHSGGASTTVWPHKYSLEWEYPSFRLDDKKITTYACSSELFGGSGKTSSGIGVFCHEYSHVLGLPDLYMTDGGYSYLSGDYDVMNSGNYNNNSRTPCGYSAFERYSLGWLELEELDTPADGIELEAVGTSNKGYRLSTNRKNEYFTVENRQQTGWDTYIPGAGMMITHIDYDANIWLRNAPNNDPDHPRVLLMAADGTNDDATAADDLFPNSKGANAFTDNTSPSSLTWSGEKIDRWITNITQTDGIVKFDFMPNHIKAPSNPEASNIGKNGFTANWGSVDEAQSYTLRLYRLLPQNDNPTALYEDFTLMEAGSSTRPDGTNIAQSLDKYTNIPGWTGSRVYQAGGYCYLGGYAISGALETPKTNLTKGDGTYTVVLNLKAYNGKTPTVMVESNGQTASHVIDDTEKTYIYVFKNGTNETSVKLRVDKERLFVNDFKVLRYDATGDYPEATIVEVNAGAAAVQRSNENEGIDVSEYYSELVKTVEGLTTTSHSFDNLDNGLYSFTVQSVGSEETSKESKAVVVDINSGIEKATTSAWLTCQGRTLQIADCKENDQVAVYSIDGSLIHSSRANASTVSVTIENGGVYIVQKQDEFKKIVVR